MNGEPGGYIRLFRKMTENPVWCQLSPAVLKVMIGFLLKANWKAGTWYDGTREVEVPRGSFITSYPKMAEFCRLTTKQIRLAFDHLERLQFAAYQRAPRWTMVTILNYGIYQDQETEQGTVEGTIRARLGHDQGTMRAPIEEGNKGIREENTPPTPSEEGEASALPKPRSSRKRKSRTLDEVRKDLGIRLPWFEALCSVHPAGKDGVKPAAEAFERKVTPDESGHQLAQEMYRGARAYADRCKADPTIKVKWMQGWINDERWRDENRIPEPPTHPVDQATASPSQAVTIDQLKAQRERRRQEQGYAESA